MTAKSFTPSLRLTLFAAIFLPVLCALGTWQWQRADAKVEIETRLVTQAALPPRRIDTASPAPLEHLARASVRGRVLGDRLVLRDNRTHEGRVGYEVFAAVAPERLAEDPQEERADEPQVERARERASAVLVNFGWIEAPAERSHLPRPTLPAVVVTLVGTLDLQRGQGVAFGPISEGEAWPRRVQQIDLAALGEALDLRLYPAVLVADPGMPGVQTYSWQAAQMSSATHRGYAVQWFGLALVLLVGWVVASLRTPGAPRD
jgi:surfeit locus 1 family protein